MASNLSVCQYRLYPNLEFNFLVPYDISRDNPATLAILELFSSHRTNEFIAKIRVSLTGNFFHPLWYNESFKLDK